MILRPRLASHKSYYYSPTSKFGTPSSSMVLRPREAYKHTMIRKKRRSHTKSNNVKTSSTIALDKTTWQLFLDSEKEDLMPAFVLGQLAFPVKSA